MRWSALILSVLIVGCTAASSSLAQTADDSPPLIAGRISLAEGDAQIWRVEEDTAGQWDAAEINDVVSPGAGLYTGANGRIEVRAGPNTFRLGTNSRGGFSQLDYATAAFNVEYGSINIHLARPEHGERTEVTATGVALDLAAPGRYRIDVVDRGAVRLSVFEGYGTVRAASGSTGVASSQAIVLQPGGGFNYEQAISTDFDQWALARDERYRNVRSAQYVSPYMTGYEELDNYGDWVSDATYGTVWYPRAVPVGWAPYRDGQWRWVRPWGWTWVDHAPWGYAPFHYGRWLYAGHRWCWVPGGYVRRPVWGPAFVGFVGSSAGDRIWGGVRGPLIGWYPLAPWHRYEPHYRHNPRYVTVINQTIINQPPRGVPPTVNHGPGATMVPGPRFREPVTKVALQVRPKAEELKAVAPPPLNVAPAPRPSSRRFAEQDQRGGPENRVVPPAQRVPAPQAGVPTRVSPPMAADPIPGRGIAPQPALPGNDPAPLAQPPGFKRVQPAPPLPAQPAPPSERPVPRAHMPSDQIPPGQPKPINPAEPARYPPGAPPTIRQGMAPPARPVQSVPKPPAAVVPAPQARPTPPAVAPGPAVAPAPVAPPAAVSAKDNAPTPKVQAMRNAQENAERGRGNNDGPGRGKTP